MNRTRIMLHESGEFTLAQSDDPGWLSFTGRIVLNALHLDNEDQRYGQRIMNGLRDESPTMFVCITGTKDDIWELDYKDYKRMHAFFAALFDLYVESL